MYGGERHVSNNVQPIKWLEVNMLSSPEDQPRGAKQAG